MNIFFRVDASKSIGIGHFMRCLTIANEMRNLGESCFFISRELSQHSIQLLEKNNHDYLQLPVHNLPKKTEGNFDWLPISSIHDANETLEILASKEPGVLILDQYGIDKAWTSIVRPATKKVIIIDDLANRELDCSLLINPTYGMTDEHYLGLVSEDCKKLIGSKYAPLRDEFSQLRSVAIMKRSSSRPIKRILVFLGGGLQTKNIKIVLDSLKEINWNNEIYIDLIINKDDPIINYLTNKQNEYPYKINIFSNIGNMAELILETDLAIGSAGSTSWERCCLGLPSIVKVIADNQRLIAENLKKTGAALLWENSDQLINAIEKFISSKSFQKRMIKSAFEVCDGLGAQRISQYINNSFILDIR